jgi:hypothetical protein
MDTKEEQLPEEQLSENTTSQEVSSDDQAIELSDAASGDEPTDDAPDLVASLRAEYNLPEAWSDEHVEAWYLTVAELPENTVLGEEGVHYVDPTRAARALNDWSTAELLCGLKGQLLDFDETQFKAVFAEYAKRESVEMAWTAQQQFEFYRQGIVPEKTSNGVWVTDITRNTRAPSAWTTAELEAWALGEITASSSASNAKLALELKNRLKLNPTNDSADAVKLAYRNSIGAGLTKSTIDVAAETPAPSKVDVMVDPGREAIKNTPVVEGLNPMNVSFIDGALERYATAVKPGQFITEEKGIAAQAGLEQLFTYAIQQPEPKAMVAALQRIKEYVGRHLNDLFSPSMAYRFTGGLRETMRQRHVNFVELLRVYADSNTDARKQVDLRYMLKDQPVDKQEMLIEYFSKHA